MPRPFPEAYGSTSNAGTVVGVTCAILVLLFTFQRFGTSKVGFTFAPVVLLWFVANVMVNLYNIIVYYPGGPTTSLQCQSLLQHTALHAIIQAFTLFMPHIMIGSHDLHVTSCVAARAVIKR